MYFTYMIKVPKDEKAAVEKRKKLLQHKILKKLGIYVDFPTQGAGNTNCGNTARTYFKNIKIIHDITGTKI